MTRRVPMLVALTREARRALSGAADVALTRLPFRVGREARSPVGTGIQLADERRRDRLPRSNDLYIRDAGPLFNVSREHFQIETDQSGGFVLRDRGSVAGTGVDDLRLGGDGPSSCPLKPGSVIVVGGARSRLAFRFEPAGTKTPGEGRDKSAQDKARSAWNLPPSD